jgi:Bacterial Ig-like domain (group 2)
MFVRRYLKGFLLLGLSLSLMGCADNSLIGITITPSVAYFSYAAGLQRQFHAVGTFEQGHHPETTQDITDQVTWESDTTGIATVSSSGLVTTTGVDYGNADITARMNGFTGLIIAHSTATVCAPGSTTVTSGGC